MKAAFTLMAVLVLPPLRLAWGEVSAPQLSTLNSQPFQQQDGAAAAQRAHNAKVEGAIPSPAPNFPNDYGATKPNTAARPFPIEMEACMQTARESRAARCGVLPAPGQLHYTATPVGGHQTATPVGGQLSQRIHTTEGSPVADHPEQAISCAGREVNGKWAARLFWAGGLSSPALAPKPRCNALQCAPLALPVAGLPPLSGVPLLAH